MRSFTDENGEQWQTFVLEEDTPRHHGRWYLAFRTADGRVHMMPEVRWQTRESADRILDTMSVNELRRRLKIVRARSASKDGPSDADGAFVARDTTNVAAG
jgi:hypothetical protein